MSERKAVYAAQAVDAWTCECGLQLGSFAQEGVLSVELANVISVGVALELTGSERQRVATVACKCGRLYVVDVLRNGQNGALLAKLFGSGAWNRN